MYSHETYRMHYDVLQRTGRALWKNSWEPLLYTGVTIASGCVLGAVAGEAADHTPYFSGALAHGLALLTHNDPALFENNLDTVGSALGLLAGAFIRYRIPLGARRTGTDVE